MDTLFFIALLRADDEFTTSSILARADGTLHGLEKESGVATHEILQNKIPAATEGANQGSDPEEKQAEHGKELYQINDWKYCCKLLILQPARVLARDTGSSTSRVCLRNTAARRFGAAEPNSPAQGQRANARSKAEWPAVSQQN
jgi:hypothetical protein